MRSSKYLVCLWLGIAVVFFLTQPSSAQIPGMPNLYGEFKMPEVGSFATYKVIDQKTKGERIVKLSIVGKEKSSEGKVVAEVYEYGPKPGDKTITKVMEKSEKEAYLYWYEVKETNSKTGAVNIIKMLISGNPQEIGTIQRMIVKSGKEKASELPQAVIQMINQAPAGTTEVKKPKIKKLGTEKVKIKDKTLKCNHLQYRAADKTVADVWTNAEIPLFGLVKSTSPQIVMELLKYGTDAVSAIKEKPEVLDLPGLK